MAENQKIKVEVAYAMPDEQFLLELQLEQGSNVQDAIQESGILLQYSQIDLSRQKIGIFGRFVELDSSLSDGDRVEIYRSLKISPKEARRLRAQRVDKK